ncbi:hypothetical protein BH10BAC2_BH10BAC2_23380 [soil metagenome]
MPGSIQKVEECDAIKASFYDQLPDKKIIVFPYLKYHQYLNWFYF